MSNEFVMVPRELAEMAVDAIRDLLKETDPMTAGTWTDIPEKFKVILSKPAEQHRGEPVALPAAKELVRAWGHDMGGNYEEGTAFGWNACLDEIAKLGPLFTRPVQGDPEIIGERCADGGKCHHMCKTECFRKDGCVPLGSSGLTDDWKEPSAPTFADAIKNPPKWVGKHLATKVEPSAPKCKYCGDTGQIMVGRSGDANDGNAPIMEPCEDCDGPNAPVEIDERTAFDPLEWLETEITAVDTWYRGSPSYEHDAGWMKDQALRLVAEARAALERKQ